MSPRARDSMYSPEQHGIANALASWGQAMMPATTADQMKAKLFMMQQEEAAKRLGETTQPTGNIVEALKFLSAPAPEQQRLSQLTNPETADFGEQGAQVEAPKYARAQEALSAPRMTGAWKPPASAGGTAGYTAQKIMKQVNQEAETALSKLQGSLDKMEAADADREYSARRPGIMTGTFMRVFRSVLKRLPSTQEALDSLGPDFDEAAYGKWAVTPVKPKPAESTILPAGGKTKTGGPPGLITR